MKKFFRPTRRRYSCSRIVDIKHRMGLPRCLAIWNAEVSKSPNFLEEPQISIGQQTHKDGDSNVKFAPVLTESPHNTLPHCHCPKSFHLKHKLGNTLSKSLDLVLIFFNVVSCTRAGEQNLTCL